MKSREQWSWDLSSRWRSELKEIKAQSGIFFSAWVLKRDTCWGKRRHYLRESEQIRSGKSIIRVACLFKSRKMLDLNRKATRKADEENSQKQKSGSILWWSVLRVISLRFSIWDRDQGSQDGWNLEKRDFRLDFPRFRVRVQSILIWGSQKSLRKGA